MARMLRRVGAGTLATIASVLLLPAPAHADVTCDFSGTSITLALQQSSGTVRIVRAGADIAVTEGGAPVDCGVPGPTVHSVDSIHVVEGPGLIDSTVEVDLSGGPFAPGATVEPDGEIGFDIDLGDGWVDRVTIIGSDQADHITLSSEGINLNAAEAVPDIDALLTGVTRVHMEMGAGGDVVDAGGASPMAFRLLLRVEGGPGEDALTGGAAGDVLLGQADDDVLAGGPGNDELDGGDGADDLSGDEGNDLLRGGLGDDQEAGGPGDDTFDQGDAPDGGDDLVGGTGDDAVAYDLRAADVVVTLDGDADDGAAGEGDNVRSSIEQVLGGWGDDILTGNAGDNALVGGRGNDTLNGGSGDDTLNGGPGDDVLNGGPGTDLASYFDADGGVRVSLADGTATGDGDDTLMNIENVTGTAYADVLEGDGGPNVLIGRGGADRLLGRGGADRLLGGRGSDRLVGGPGDNPMDGGPGMDTVSFADAPRGVRVDLAAGVATGQGEDVLARVENVIGSDFNDRIWGTGGPNVIRGGAGDDVIRGRGGPDRLEGGRGRDVLYGQRGADLLMGGWGRDLLFSGPGPDLLDGGPGFDRCRPGPGRDRIQRCEA